MLFMRKTPIALSTRARPELGLLPRPAKRGEGWGEGLLCAVAPHPSDRVAAPFSHLPAISAFTRVFDALWRGEGAGCNAPIPLRRKPRTSIQLPARGLDDRGSFRNFPLDLRRELLRTAVPDADAETPARRLARRVVARGR